MEQPEKLEDFYRRKFKWLPEEVRQQIGHFNIFQLQPFVEGKPTSIPYRRRDFYKIMLVKGNSRVHYADQVIEIKGQALSFSNPQIPYKWEHLDWIREGIYCIFSADFFHQFGQFQHYEVFQPDGSYIFELTDEQAIRIREIFSGMESEFSSDYKYRYDVIRNHIFELLHFALKLVPSGEHETQPINASQRIAVLFLELLERQFPIDDTHRRVGLRSASDFAYQLNIHVNHLNRAVKEATQKSTSQVIAERVLQEAKVLLRHSDWNVADIAYALGFTEATHFANFFKKHTQISPSQFKKS
ncbi:MAG: helix-turn-helix transcriptional regulator [Cyclobacteriaceae bacterium]